MTESNAALIEQLSDNTPVTDWLERLDDEDVPSAPVLGRHEVLDHPQIQANEMIVEEVLEFSLGNFD